MENVKRKFAAEIGGTFTDIIYFQEKDGRSVLEILKVASTPSHPEQAVIEGADRLIPDWSDMGEMLHGSTVATNAVLERSGVKSALLVTEGFADVLEIQRGDKENVYDLFYQRRKPIIPRDMVYPVMERVTADGEILNPLDEGQIRSIARELKEKAVTSVGICYLHSYAFVDHERRTKEILEQELPEVIITASYEILPQFREYERSSTVAITSYIAPVMVNYIEKLYGELKQRNFNGEIFITQSNGGIIPMGALRKEVARTLLSGPAAGVTGAAFMAHQLGIDNIITLDIGGTSADVCFVNHGEPLVSTENKIDGSAIAVPMLDIVTVGAGGGSIAWMDEGGMLQVGPKSAGAVPGPACYDRGGNKPTVSDALAYRGFIRPEHFAGGNYPLKIENAGKVIGELAEQAGVSSDEIAEAVIRIMEANTMQAVRLVSTERGYDARQYTMVAFGGGGGLHAANIADELGITNVLVPCYAGILSSFGLLVADVIRDYVQTHVSRCSDTTSDMLKEQFTQIQEHATDSMVSYGFDRDKIVFKYAVDARYLGQAFELQLDFEEIPQCASEVASLFHEKHLARYGCNSPDNDVEIVNYRLKTVIPQDNHLLESMKYNPKLDKYYPVDSKVLIGGRWQDCKFYTWSNLPINANIQGPAVVEDDTTTCFIPECWVGLLQENGSLLLKRKEN